MQFDGRIGKVMVGNEVGRARSAVQVGVQDSHTTKQRVQSLCLLPMWPR